MKLRNKKTGEIIDLSKGLIMDSMNGREIILKSEGTTYGETYGYHSLAELNADWEDCEEPKEYWFVNDLDGKPMKCELRYCPVRDFAEWAEKRKKIGNYFATEEEAKKAVEKLKAWKRLKDKGGFLFDGRTSVHGNTVKIRARVGLDLTGEISNDLDLLFGGREE